MHPSLNSFKWTLFSNNMAIRTPLTVALPGCCQIEMSYSDPMGQNKVGPWANCHQNLKTKGTNGLEMLTHLISCHISGVTKQNLAWQNNEGMALEIVGLF